MSSHQNYAQMYGGSINEEEFVDVQNQDFANVHYGTADEFVEQQFPHPEAHEFLPEFEKMPAEAKTAPEGAQEMHDAANVEESNNSADRGGDDVGAAAPQEVDQQQQPYVGESGEVLPENVENPVPTAAAIPDPNNIVDNVGERCLLAEIKEMHLEAGDQQQQQNGGFEGVQDGAAGGEELAPVAVAVPALAPVQADVLDERPLEEPSTPTTPKAPKPTDPRPLNELMAAETNYPIPYRSKLTEPFEPGQTLIVKGKTAEDSVRFTINLHHASADFSGNDVPLHISVRFDEGKIVFNTFTKGEWGKEERKSNPYKKGEDIDIRIRAHDSKYTIFADQKEIKEFEHRVPLSSVSHFSIDGDILVTHIHWGGKYYPVPYESGITGDGFNPGKTLLIFGTPEKKGKRFHINLLKKNGDIALHFNPRFDEKAIVRNSLIANEWGNEEREGKNPLEKGIGFDLKVVNEEYAFQIFINDERFCSYAHRMEPHDIHGLQIGGDVEITGIQIF